MCFDKFWVDSINLDFWGEGLGEWKCYCVYGVFWSGVCDGGVYVGYFGNGGDIDNWIVFLCFYCRCDGLCYLVSVNNVCGIDILKVIGVECF